MELRVGDSVDVPGGMHGIVKFVGSVDGKRGTFAGVQLATEFAARGKNSGDVEGKRYFRTSAPGSGIFLPIDKANRRAPATPATPATPSLPRFTPGARTSAVAKPDFSQSVGPGVRPSSSAARPKLRRPSLPRPESPLRRAAAKTTPKMPTPGTRVSTTPASKSKIGTGSRYGQNPIIKPPNLAASLRANSALSNRVPLGPEAAFDEDSDSTPTPTPIPRKFYEANMGDVEVERLKQSLDEKDRQLKEQASTLADMERSVIELQSLLPAETGSAPRAEAASSDLAHLRNIIKEKNEKIQILATDFDAHRADFRSTIDTLEMASTETERVYEQRVDELLRENRELQDRGEDLGTVSKQLKQLEELVQELEEGLEDARRGEAEARGEVEFLRGEVERGRSELKRERSKISNETREDDSGIGSNRSSFRELEARDDEIRGLKAIILSLSSESPNGSRGGPIDVDHEINFSQTQSRLGELEKILAAKTAREGDLERELERLRSVPPPSSPDKRSNAMHGTHRLSDRTIVPRDWRDHAPPPAMPTQLENPPETDAQSTATDSSSTLWCEICETGGHDILTCTNIDFSSQNTNGTNGTHEPTHDPDALSPPNRLSDPDRVAPLKKKASYNTLPATSAPYSPPPGGPLPPPPPGSAPGSALPTPKLSATLVGDSIPPRAPPSSLVGTVAASGGSETGLALPSARVPNPNDRGMVAGKESGVIDQGKWCALCERDGHDSVDCPFEDAF